MEQFVFNSCNHQNVKHINLDEFLEEFNQWKKTANLIVKQNIHLKEEVKVLENKLDLAEKKENINLIEISRMSSMINNLQETIDHLIHLEDENKNIKTQLLLLNTENQEYEMNQIENEKKLNQKMEELTAKLTSQIKATEEEAEENKKNIIVTYEKKLKEHHDEILKMKKEFNEQIKEKADLIIKLELEYEGKITKLKDQIVKSNKSSNSYTNNLQEIFRQKQQQMKQKYETTISMLNEEINNLKHENHDSNKMHNLNLTKELKDDSKAKSINIKNIAKILNSNAAANDNCNNDDDSKNTNSYKGNGKMSKKRKLFQPDKSYM